MQQKRESGRSLIEIIAVLVIIAILLLAAILGFKALLDYLKRKETAEQIGIIGMRYKVDRLGKKTRGGNVLLKEVYPEGNNCNNDTTCITTPDGGQIRLFAYPDTSTFVVIASQISPQACTEAVLQKGYTRVKRFTALTTDGSAFFEDSKNGFKKEEEFKLDSYLSVEDFRKNPEKTLDFCCGGQNYENTTCSFGFIYSNSVSGEDCRYFVNGQCSYCPEGQVKAPRGASPNSWNDGCCDEKEVSCGVCGGCEGGDRLCKNGICVECENDGDCNGKEKDGIRTPFCDKRTGRCVPCKEIGQECTPSGGVGIGTMYCLNDIGGCEPCTGTPCGYDCACCKPDATRPGQWILKNPVTQEEGKDCIIDGNCPSCATPMFCNNTFKCECPAKNTLQKGEKCNDSLCSGVCDSTKGLVCLNGTCQEQPTCAEPEQAKRLFDVACTSDTICPCANTYLTCRERKCACAAVPTHKDDYCWGECGCGVGLKCSTQGQTVEGQCECADLTRGSPCVPTSKGGECPCGAGLECPTDGPYECQCNPPAESFELEAGEDCAGEDVCPHQCKTGLTCVNGKCGCETDADCNQCGGEKCDTNTHTCVCGTGFKKVGEKCVCDEGETYVPWFIKESGPHMCCPTGKMPYSYNGEYVCVPVCDGDSIKQIAILLDYSNSLKTIDPEGKVHSTAKKIINTLNDFNKSLSTKIDISIQREDLDGCKQGSAICDSTEDSKRKITGGPSNQKLCACNQIIKKRNGKSSGGGTKFDKAIASISDTKHTLAVLISDGMVPDTSFDGKGFKNVLTIDNGNDVDWGNFGHYVFANFEQNGFADLFTKEIISNLCVPKEDVEKLVPNQYCPGNENWQGS